VGLQGTGQSRGGLTGGQRPGGLVDGSLVGSGLVGLQVGGPVGWWTAAWCDSGPVGL
jgi:hypothetical protein